MMDRKDAELQQLLLEQKQRESECAGDNICIYPTMITLVPQMHPLAHPTSTSTITLSTTTSTVGVPTTMSSSDPRPGDSVGKRMYTCIAMGQCVSSTYSSEFLLTIPFCIQNLAFHSSYEPNHSIFLLKACYFLFRSQYNWFYLSVSM